MRTATIEAYTMQYGEIFGITAIVCVVGALLGLLISRHHEHADEPAPTIDADDTPTQLIDAPTQAIDAPARAISTQGADETVRIQRQQPEPPGRHRR